MEEGAGKRCSECVIVLMVSVLRTHSNTELNLILILTGSNRPYVVSVDVKPYNQSIDSIIIHSVLDYLSSLIVICLNSEIGADLNQQRQLNDKLFLENV